MPTTLPGIIETPKASYQHEGAIVAQADTDRQFVQEQTNMPAIVGAGPRALEAMLSGQMIAANDAALDMYRRAWVPEQNIDIRMKYLALTDKAARTVALLAETLDRHRGRGQQQITVKHITVNANQAVVADQVVTGSGGGGGGTRTGDQPHALIHASGTPLYSEIEAVREAVPRACR